MLMKVPIYSFLNFCAFNSTCSINIYIDTKTFKNGEQFSVNLTAIHSHMHNQRGGSILLTLVLQFYISESKTGKVCKRWEEYETGLIFFLKFNLSYCREAQQPYVITNMSNCISIIINHIELV